MARTIARSTSVPLALFTVLALLLTTVWAPPALAEPTPTDDPAEAAAGWLVSALTDDPAVGTEFGASVGTTIDVLFALAAVGVAADTIEGIADFVTDEVATYTQGAGFDQDDAAYAGASAKLALGLLIAERDPRDAGGVDLIEQLLSLEVDDPDAVLGRFSDRGEFDDFSTPLTQSLALLALERAPGTAPSDDAVAALVDQACPDGGFPNQFEPETCTSSVDTTGFAVQALFAVGADDAAGAAVSWLEEEQADDGSFSSPDGINTNSTGLAAVALSLGGATEAAAAAAEWIISQQDDCDTETPGAIPFNAEDRGFVELATAQAVPGLVGASLASISSTGASSAVPFLECEAASPDAPEDDADTEDLAEATEGSQDGSATGSAEATDDEQDIPRPTRVDSGLSPSSGPGWYTLALVLGGALLLGGIVASRRQHSEQ